MLEDLLPNRFGNGGRKIFTVDTTDMVIQGKFSFWGLCVDFASHVWK